MCSFQELSQSAEMNFRADTGNKLFCLLIIFPLEWRESAEEPAFSKYLQMKGLF
jgi:hypothetical protein